MRTTSVIKGAFMKFASAATPNQTAVDVSLLIIRVIVGTIMAAHGSQKVFGAFGGPGLTAIAEMMGPVGYLVAIGEFFGGLGMMVGFLSRFSAAANIVIMLGAIAMVHGKNGFFQSASGFEYNLALIGLLAPILIAGPGRYAIGRFLPLPKSSATGRPLIGLE
jgi:putative oxidoreductase